MLVLLQRRPAPIHPLLYDLFQKYTSEFTGKFPTGSQQLLISRDDNRILLEATGSAVEPLAPDIEQLLYRGNGRDYSLLLETPRLITNH